MDKETGFISHLAELRKRLIHSLIFLSVLFVICYFFSEYIYGFLVNPYAEAVRDDGIERRLIFTALQETFLTYLKVSFFAAFFITSPFILIQIWKFIAPGLYTHEKKSNYALSNYYTNFISFRRNACLLFNNAACDKVFFII